MKIVAASVALCLFLAGCAASSIPVTPQIKQDMRTIGIISAVGDRVRYQRVAFGGFFDSARSEKDTSGWGIDALAVTTIKSLIEKKYTVVDIPPIPLPKGSEPLSAEQLVALDKERRGTPIDAYLVLKPVEVPDFITRTQRPIFGLGIYYAPTFGIEAYAACTIFMIDGGNSKAFAAAALRMDVEPASIGSRLVSRRPSNTLRRPHQPIDKSIADAADWDAITPIQAKMIENALKDMIYEGIRPALQDLQLIP